ncbi:hypothetical protein GLYMA_13G350975v4 [Glycine max]|nr:hypothetical protein GLYMA_13G350975v4 [Glycine max]KAH1104978.1 hypothetical protein GYH30_038337 [Glycine max]
MPLLGWITLLRLEMKALATTRDHHILLMCYPRAWTALGSQSCSTGVERLLMRMVFNFLPIYFSYLFPLWLIVVQLLLIV